MEALIGINPDDTIRVEFKKAVFVLGVIDAQMWNVLYHRFSKVYQDAMRRSIAAAVEGEDENEKFLRIARDDLYVQEVFPVHMDTIRYAVRSHERIVAKGGTPIAFEQEEVNGRKVVSLKLLSWYALIPGLFDFLYGEIRAMHRLEVDAKKD